MEIKMEHGKKKLPCGAPRDVETSRVIVFDVYLSFANLLSLFI